MPRPKAVAEIISVILIAVFTIALVGTAMMWGMPLIRQQQDSAKLDRIRSYFNVENSNSLIWKIGYVAKNGGKETVVVDSDGLWMLHPYDAGGADSNSIDFVTFSTSDSGYSSIWMAVDEGESCPPADGIVGVDSPMVGCTKADAFQDGYNVTYRAWSRRLLDQSGTRGYKISLMQDSAGRMASSENTLTISQERVYTCTPPGLDNECPDKTLIITEIKILLV
jgi:hypothetical protein